MSQYYEMGDRTLWNPSSGVSRLFLRQVALYEAELGVPSGFGPMEADVSRIDPAGFTAFVDALLVRHSKTRNAVMKTLSEGFVVTVLVLAQKAGIEMAALSGAGGESWAVGLLERAREMRRHMVDGM
ncbi:DUF6086 family protein [Streptomyces sp. NPDC059396]|uniref:DUF6086 family protein n=1 Tax=Streptomyces sp. NPDC059396 TaxID=3346819 RepID=UPI0036A622FB